MNTGPTEDTGPTVNSGEPGEPVARPRRLVLVLGVALGVLALDQISKAIALTTLADRPPVRLLGGALTLRLVRNAGAAFGLATGFTIVLTVIAATVVVTIMRIASKLVSAWWAVALGMLLGGAMGNLTDRIFRDPAPLRGHVVDFLAFPHWPVFNLADSAIVGAGILMVILTFRGIGFDGTVEPADAPRPGDRS